MQTNNFAEKISTTTVSANTSHEAGTGGAGPRVINLENGVAPISITVKLGELLFSNGKL